jgi:hypothetical protein
VAADKCERDEAIEAEQARRLADVGRVVDECMTHEDRPFIGRWPNPVHYAQRIEPKDVKP